MKKNILIQRGVLLAILLVSIASLSVSAQQRSNGKPVIDTAALGKWPRISYALITNDGKYSMFIVDDDKHNISTLNVVSNESEWKINIPSIRRDISFSNNNQYAYFLNSNDSLGIITLGENNIKYVSNVGSFKLSENGNRQWLAYLKSGASAELEVTNITTQKTNTYHNLSDYLFGKKDNLILVTTTNLEKKKISQAAQWIDLTNGATKTFWSGYLADNFVFDNSGKELAFITTDGKDTNPHDSLFVYNENTQRATCLLSDQSPEIGTGFSLANEQPMFSKTGGKLLLSLNKEEKTSTHSNGYSKVDIWNYKDLYVQSDQESPKFPLQSRTKYYAVENLRNGELVPLNKEGEFIIRPDSFENYILVLTKPVPSSFYNNATKPSLYLCSAENGSRKTLVEKQLITVFYLSPDEHYALWFNPDSLSYFSYAIPTNKKVNFSKLVPQYLYDRESANNGQSLSAPFGIAGWQVEDHSVYIYDQFDIWKVDLEGIRKSINITNAYGRRNSIVYGLLSQARDADVKVIHPKDKLLLEGYNLTNKYNGFWSIASNQQGDPTKANMEPDAYCITRTGRIGHVDIPTTFPPLKAANANTYIVQRKTASEFPNLYVTHNFKSYKPISDIHPEKNYNWLTAELIEWKMPDGRMSQGVLYKPENFDSTKKYPLIIQYYEKKSDLLNEYLEPHFSQNELNIPYYVSNGYIIFVPDIYYEKGHMGRGVVNSVLSAARYLAKLPWLDSTEMGIQGHSFGGWETNFLVTHTHLFAAACAAASIADHVSAYDDKQSGDYGQALYELYHGGSPYGLGVTPWTRPDLYVENSPIFFVDKVTTPLLLMHGDADVGVSFSQAVEMYLGLRRAGKKVWLLQYEGGNHSITGKNAKDYTIRMKQFFDYYLKDAPPPKWMTVGVPAAMKGIDDGLSLDLSGAKP